MRICQILFGMTRNDFRKQLGELVRQGIDEVDYRDMVAELECVKLHLVSSFQQASLDEMRKEN